jgi:hypothetical protein
MTSERLREKAESGPEVVSFFEIVETEPPLATIVAIRLTVSV